MAASKVSLSIDEHALAEARRRVGSRGLSSCVSAALQRQLQYDRIGELLADMEGESGPIDPTVLEEARELWRSLIVASVDRLGGGVVLTGDSSDLTALADGLDSVHIQTR